MDIKTLNRISKLGGPRTIEDVKKICYYLRIYNYTINKDLTVDVSWDVWLDGLDLEKIPLKFGKVDGNFHCSYNKLTSLEGCPEEVVDIFSCSNNNLTSLKGSPEFVGKTFYCYSNKVRFTEEDVKKVCKVKGLIYN